MLKSYLQKAQEKLNKIFTGVGRVVIKEAHIVDDKVHSASQAIQNSKWAKELDEAGKKLGGTTPDPKVGADLK